MLCLPSIILTPGHKQGIKIIQTFVTEKIILSMAVSMFKWLLFGSFLMIGQPRPANNSTTSNPHPYYISVVEVNHNAADKTLEISCKIFTNDFETTLEKNYRTKVDLVNPKDKATMDKLISDYIPKHLSFKVDGRPVNYSYVGYEKEDEAIYSYWQVDNIPSLKKLDITNSILHDFSDQQINIVHVTVNGKRQSVKLDYPGTVASFSF
jgi:hypothetical protein